MRRKDRAKQDRCVLFDVFTADTDIVAEAECLSILTGIPLRRVKKALAVMVKGGSIRCTEAMTNGPTGRKVTQLYRIAAVPRYTSQGARR